MRDRFLMIHLSFIGVNAKFLGPLYMYINVYMPLNKGWGDLLSCGTYTYSSLNANSSSVKFHEREGEVLKKA